MIKYNGKQISRSVVTNFQSEWTFIFLIIFKDSASDRDVLSNLKNFITAMLEAKISNKILVVFGVKGRIEILNTIITENGLGDLIDGEKDDVNTIFFSEKKIIEKHPKFLFSEKSFLIYFFKEIVLKTFASKKYSLFTIDHSQPYGIFSENGANLLNHKKLEVKINGKNLDDASTSTIPFFLANFGKKRMRQLFKVKDDDMPKILTMTELRDSIITSFNKKIDVIVMANCFSQFFDTGYVLSDASSLFIASEGEVNGNPINFSYFFDKFNQTDMSLENFRNCLINSVDCYPDGFPSIGIEERALIGGIFGNDLTKYSELAHLLDQLADLLSGILEEDFEMIYNIRKECGAIRSGRRFSIIDLFSFCTLLAVELKKGKDNLTSIKIVNDILHLSKIVISGSNYIGKSYPEFTLNGISIFFPLNNNINTTSLIVRFFENPTTTNAAIFVKDHQWDSFIEKYIDFCIKADKKDPDNDG